jgi:hypothetical protein
MDYYRAIAFAPDGESITEGRFKTIAEAWDHINDWGSRWVFYPFTGVIKNERVIEMCDGLSFLSNKNRSTIARDIKKNSEEYCKAI